MIVEELIAAIKLMVPTRRTAIVLVEQHTDIALELTEDAVVLERGAVAHAASPRHLAQGPRHARAPGRVARRRATRDKLPRPDSRSSVMAEPMIPRERAEYSAIVDRPPLKLPGNARIIFWTIVNYEVWDIGKPMARQLLPAPTGVALMPDVVHWALPRIRHAGRLLAVLRAVQEARHQADALGQRPHLRGL